MTFVAPTTTPLGDCLARLTAALGRGVVAATPLLVHPARPWWRATPDDLLARELGLSFSERDGVPLVGANAAGAALPYPGPVLDVAAASGACLVVDRAAFDAAGGAGPLADADAAAIDLCLRLRARGGRVVAVPGALALDDRAVRPGAGAVAPAVVRALADRHGPRLLPRSDRLRFAITVAAPSPKVAPRWGDWHFAQALARALERRGSSARVQPLSSADDPAVRTCDVHVVVRGLARVRRTPGQQHVVWVISHPETVTAEECDEADLVLVASERFAAHLRARTSTPVAVLLQATDHHRFRPFPPEARHAHEVTVVAKTRDVLRPMVADALAMGIRPAIYGNGWERFVDPALVVAQYVPNEELPIVYSSAGVVLNDHWGTMREWGFVSNRIFDALACGAPVVSDDMPEIAMLFGDAVATYRDPKELAAAVEHLLAEPGEARARAQRGREAVLRSHTFDHRADALLELLAGLR